MPSLPAGMIRGPGTGTSDSILARVSNREYIVNAEATEQHRPLLEAINSGRIPRFAAGGPVGRMPSVPQFTIPQVRLPAAALPSARAAQGSQNVKISVDVSGAQGDKAIEARVMAGVDAALKENNRHRDRTLAARARIADQRFG